MKKLYFLIILASMAFLLASCGDKKVDPPTEDPPPCVGDDCEDAPPAPPEPEPEPDPPEPKEDEPEPHPEPEQ